MRRGLLESLGGSINMYTFKKNFLGFAHISTSGLRDTRAHISSFWSRCSPALMMGWTPCGEERSRKNLWLVRSSKRANLAWRDQPSSFQRIWAAAEITVGENSGCEYPSVQAKSFLAGFALPGTHFSTRKKMVPLGGRPCWHGAG